MEYPHNHITGQTNREDATAFVTLYVQSEFFPIDESALTAHIQQWLLDNVPEIVATTAERREQTFPVTALPPLPA
ncbi:hypothetical protein [Streptomyces achromogenes]|uniref:hypothetical protein n=1 Tax=Streptomyces achromogenes TaxID=67255 RepID=UPI003A8086C0